MKEVITVTFNETERILKYRDRLTAEGLLEGVLGVLAC